EPETFQPNPSTIMGGAATISNPFMKVFIDNGINEFGLGTSGSAQPSDGVKAMGLNRSEQTATITFDLPVSDFGAYWGAATHSTLGDPANISISFFDASDSLIGSEIFSYSRSTQGDGLLEWH